MKLLKFIKLKGSREMDVVSNKVKRFSREGSMLVCIDILWGYV